MLPIIEQAKKKLHEGRIQIRGEHDAGLEAQSVTSKIADLADDILLELIQEALEFATDGDPSLLEHKIALVPHGGYGRRDMAPYSDLDLMLLYLPDSKANVEKFAQRLVQHITDTGFDLGFSTRTPNEAVALSLKDVRIYTSIVECRFLSGSVSIYSRFCTRFARQANRKMHGLVRAIEESRLEERQKNGNTAFLLRPNIKKTKGGLRDIQLIRWIGFTKHGKSDLDSLLEAGGLSETDHHNVTEAHRFLLRLRNEMHFQAGKVRDVLGMNEQVRIAEQWGYEPVAGELPVERLMRDYFGHTSKVVYASNHLLATAKSRFHFSDLITPLFSHQQEGYFRIGPVHISTTRKGLEYVTGNLEGILHLVSLANLHDKLIDHSTWEAIRHSMLKVDRIELSSTSIWRFCTFISDHARLSSLLRRLNEMRVLEKLIPSFRHVRSLVQFNEYHKYTVDEHSFRVVEAATSYFERDDVLGKCYQSVRNKRVLHLALLLHDIGKGYDEDHSVVGARIAADTADDLQLKRQEKEDLVFLVRHHLMMAHIAMRRDISDSSQVASFAADVGSSEMLKMLYVLTCADMQGVGPDVLNDWKLNLISQLYLRAQSKLSLESPEEFSDKIFDRAKQETIDELRKSGEIPLADFAGQMRADFFDGRSRDLSVSIVSKLHGLEGDNFFVDATYNSTEKTSEYLIGKLDGPYTAVLHRITGALTSQSLKIFSVDISRIQNDRILYQFKVVDPNINDQIAESRMESVKKEIQEILLNEDAKPRFRKIWGQKEGPSTEQATIPARIRVDNESTDKATIIDVFTHDRTGLLYTITQTLHDLGLRISGAKVGTYLDQVVDVFYVTDVNARKIRDVKRIQTIKSTLLSKIESHS